MTPVARRSSSRATQARLAACVLLLSLLLLSPLATAQEEARTPPTAAFTVSPQRPSPGDGVTASALPVSKAFPPCSPIETYEWDWDDDQVFEENKSHAAAGFVSEHAFATAGVYAVSLRVTDSCGQSATATVNVTVGEPVAGLDWDIVLDNRTSFINAALLVVYLSVVAILAGLPLGILVAMMRISGIAPVRWFAALYVEFLRGTPLLVQIFIVWLALPALSKDLRFDAVTAGLIALIVNTSAYQSEIVRAGIQAIPSAQLEAALGMGFSRTQAMRFIVLPQALRLVIPPLTNEFIILIKDTSLLSTIGVVELMLTARILGNRYFSVVEPFVAIALIYFLITFALSQALQRMEKKLAIPGMGIRRPGGAH